MAEQATISGESQSPGYLTNFGPIAANTLRDIAATAKMKPLVMPLDSSERGYRPSAALAEFVRCRDLTCRFPGCDQPAEVCDLDHTVPFPLGPTHPSNLKLLCRYHHRLKTFWTGWRDQRRPDGTIVWTSPTGHTYITRPGSRLLFPALCLPTGELPTVPTQYRPPGNRRHDAPTPPNPTTRPRSPHQRRATRHRPTADHHPR
jgi:hypothetical protein